MLKKQLFQQGLRIIKTILFSRYATAPLTRGAPLLSLNADGISDISPVLRGNCPLGEAL